MPDTRLRDAAIPSVVVVGSASRDLTDEDPRGWRLGGGVTYGALTLARLGLRTGALIGLDTEAMHASELDLLRDAGVMVVTVAQAHSPVFVNEQTPSGRVQMVVDPGELLPVSALPEAWSMAPGWLLAPVAGELPEDWARIPPAGATIAVGWQGLLRILRAGERVVRREPWSSDLLGRASLVGVSVEDLSGDCPIAALLALLAPGAELLLTAAERGGALFRVPPGAPHPLRYPALPADRTVDPTGAGDVALACMLAGRLAERMTMTDRAAPTERASATERALAAEHGWSALRRRHLRLAAAAASLTVEQPGIHGVPTHAAIRRRLSVRDAEAQPA